MHCIIVPPSRSAYQNTQCPPFQEILDSRIYVFIKFEFSLNCLQIQNQPNSRDFLPKLISNPIKFGNFISSED